RSYLYYICYIGVSALLQGALNGLSAQYLFGNSPYLTNLAVPLCLAGTIVFATLFTHSFLDTAKNLPVLNRVLWALFGFTALSAAAVFF
ncbi:7TM-DISM domain-containing protein, partial [Enterococcus faecalis]|uniref:7TM-DISM domain-containing protein n=1 Tax=Enterococcus faecalis TaxID=1351 RepID=UPI0021B0FDE9